MSQVTSELMPTAHATPAPANYMPVTDLVAQVGHIQHVMKAVMKDGEHFGKIPGCGDKPTLLKAGAEKLAMTFRLAPEYDIQEREMPGGHREYRVTVRLVSIITGTMVGSGVGLCSTMEGKYRFRAGDGEVTSVAVPKAYWDTRRSDPAAASKLLRETANKAGLEGSKFGTKKDAEGRWMVSTHGERVEHDNPADYYNTVLKMAKKRALVDAVLTSTAASDIFTQDIEDMPEVIPGVAKGQAQHPQQAQQPTASSTASVGQPPAPTQAQLKTLHDVAKAAGFDAAGLLTLCNQHTGDTLEAVNQLTRDEALAITSSIKSGQYKPTANQQMGNMPEDF
jgi:hypothetical protein